MNWLLARLQEGSTWRGIILILTVCGVKLDPEQSEAIIAAGLAVVGLIGVFTKDAPKTVNIQLPPVELQSKSESDDDGYISREALRSELQRRDYPTEHDERLQKRTNYAGGAAPKREGWNR